VIYSADCSFFFYSLEFDNIREGDPVSQGISSIFSCVNTLKFSSTKYFSLLFFIEFYWIFIYGVYGDNFTPYEAALDGR